ncbi:MAG: hypothetical protein QOC78_2844 [Solirubrobacteraceae bacterium]|jgi:hypothetical protein|nr:hypothetical protein [Solirubrobacteraceae bacterium]MEA2277884.1 hypothetical protein [Solirubrobacteraceae bacterium]
MTAVREDAIAAWRRAEARVYPTVMVDAGMYEQYLTMVRAVADELADVRTEEDLLTAWEERRELAGAVVARHAPPMRAFMDLVAVRDAAFCHRHREITREHGKEIARERLERARIEQAEWALLFDDVTPMGSHRLEMHVRSGRGLHASCKRDIDRPATYSLEVVQLDPVTGAWLLDQPPLMPAQTYRSPEEWESRIARARETFGKD